MSLHAVVVIENKVTDKALDKIRGAENFLE